MRLFASVDVCAYWSGVMLKFNISECEPSEYQSKSTYSPPRSQKQATSRAKEASAKKRESKSIWGGYGEQEVLDCAARLIRSLKHA